MDDPAILSIGTATPPRSIAQSAAAEAAIGCCASNDRESRAIRRLYQASSVHHRGSVLLGAGAGIDNFFPPDLHSRGPTTAQRMAQFERLAPPLAVKACRAAMDGAALSASEVSHLVTVTCTGFVSPGVEHRLIAELGLSPQVGRVQVGFMGCHAGLNAMAIAAAICRTHSSHRVLLCCVELCSLHFQYGWDEQKLVANALFADGAGAAILGPGPAGDWPAIAGAASRVIDGTAAEMGWAVGDHGFEMTLSPRVPGLIADHLRPWIDEFLAVHGLEVGAIGGWCIHAGGPRIVSAVAHRLGVNGSSVESSRQVLRDHGNMSSATVLFILERMARARLARPWLMLAFGPGLTAEAVLLR